MASNHRPNQGMAALHPLHHKEATTHNREDTDSHLHPHHAGTEALRYGLGVRVVRTDTIINRARPLVSNQLRAEFKWHIV